MLFTARFIPFARLAINLVAGASRIHPPRYLTLVTLAAIGWVYLETGMVSLHVFIATALGVGFTVLLMSALMGLVFLSSGTGHDESVSNLDDPDQPGGRSR